MNLLYDKFLSCNQNITTDTRKITKGCIYFALKGDKFDGNIFAEDAIEQGAAYAVVDNAKVAKGDKYILVQDVLTTLQQLANHHRKQLKIPVIGITGSNGKTTTKELVHAVLSKKYNIQYTQGNLNNHIGVPLTLLTITPQHEMAVVEMGANHQLEIDMLCRIAEPDFGIITNIGKAHLEGFGGIEGVKKGKSELYRYLKEKNGTVFLHGDDTVLADLAKENNKVTYGTNKLYDVVGKCNKNSLFVELAWRTRYKATEVKGADYIKTNLVGVYNYNNALCAACVGNYFKIEEGLINEAIQNYVPTNNRSQLQKTENNSLILDYYNANPSSMQAAIENFYNMSATDKMLVLGDMLELGDESVMEHQAIINLLHEKKLNDYLLVGPIFSSLQKEKSFVTSKEAGEFLQANPTKNKTILIKGSRGIALEEVVKAL
ncbi:MAG TPA: UDP-N-acetylmuramoyl-tripeptide--D-alanyl-D-alanine ligase [Bacteroidia bacterium]|nr:UDP-N-acetylmuramoyl-tripeptide--D-alanyl-D-alanine ligase [Bacteroidia bacterium]